MNKTSSPPEPASPKPLPLDAWHRARGARMVPFAGYAMPIQFDGIVAEHEWTRSQASLFDVSHMGQISLGGENPAAELEKLVPGAITSLGQGRMRYSLLLNEAGGILDDLMVTRTASHIALVVNGATKWDDIAHLRGHLPDTVTLTHHEDQALLALQGPKAGEVLEALIPGSGTLIFMQGALFDWDGIPLWVARAGYTGEDGFEISVPATAAEKFANALVSHDGVKPAGLGARDSLRLEAGLPLYGHDMNEAIDPVSAGLTFALTRKRRDSGGWMGHGPVMEILRNGPVQKRVGLQIDGRMPAREGAPVYAGEELVGRVTSGGFSPTLGYPIAMAYIASAHMGAGTELEIEVRNRRLTAKIVPMPFVPHNYYRGS